MRIKRIVSILAGTAILIGVSSFHVDAQCNGDGNPGIAAAGSADISRLPDAARSFMAKHFKDVRVRSCERYFAKGKYEVELMNGIDLEFNTKGEIIEIDAPGNTVLADAVVKDILPAKAYARLEKDGLTGMVESIELSKGRIYEVEANIPDPDTYLFDIDGQFIGFDD